MNKYSDKFLSAVATIYFLVLFLTLAIYLSMYFVFENVT